MFEENVVHGLVQMKYCDSDSDGTDSRMFDVEVGGIQSSLFRAVTTKISAVCPVGDLPEEN